MPTLRETMDTIKKRKKALEEAAGEGVQPSPVVQAKPDTDWENPLDPAVIEREYQKQKAAKKKKGWW